MSASAPSAWTLTRAARRDMVRIWEHGASRLSFDQADRYQRDLVRVFGLLAAHPQMARECAEVDPPVRLHPFGAHLIIYRIAEGGIEVVRVPHSRQNWQNLLNR